MSATRALVWKEWREQRWFLFGGLTILLVFPLIEALAGYIRGGRFSSDMPEGMVLGLGGVLAIFVAVGATCRDFSPGLQAFWQSRPITPTRWLLAKYIVGLAILLLACCIPVLLQLWLGRSSELTLAVLVLHTFTLVLIYSVSFLLGCLVRRAVEAAILSLAAGLLVYFLPVVLPPLGWLSVFNLLMIAERERAHWFSAGAVFMVAMLFLSAAAALAARVAVRHDWRIHLDMRTMCWLMGGIILILLGVTAFQIGANLTCEREIPLPPPRAIRPGCLVEAFPNGSTGVLMLRQSPSAHNLCRFDLSGPQPTLGPEIMVPRKAEFPPALGRELWEVPAVAWSPEHPERAYCLKHLDQEQNGAVAPTEFCLWTLALDAGPKESVIHTLDLLPSTPGLRQGSGARMCLHRDRLYIDYFHARERRHKILVISIQKPDAPAVNDVLDAGLSGFRWVRGSGEPASMPRALSDGRPDFVMFPAQGLSPRERLQVGLGLWADRETMAYENNLLVVVTREHLTTYRVAGFEGDVVHFERVGRRAATPLERLVNRWVQRVAMRDGLVYVLHGGGLSVYDVRRPEHPRRLGHYAAAHELSFALAPLPGHRVLVGGNNLHVVGPPRLD